MSQKRGEIGCAHKHTHKQILHILRDFRLYNNELMNLVKSLTGPDQIFLPHITLELELGLANANKYFSPLMMEISNDTS